MARVLKGSHTLRSSANGMNHTCLIAFPAEAGTHLPTPEGGKAERPIHYSWLCDWLCGESYRVLTKRRRQRRLWETFETSRRRRRDTPAARASTAVVQRRLDWRRDRLVALERR